MTGYLNGRTEARYPKPAKRTPKPREHIRRKAKRKAKLHDADTLFSQYIRTRDGWACRRCWSPMHPQCAHLVSRRYRATRWTAMNAICLCSRCHTYFTHRPIEWEDWCDERFPGRMPEMKVQARAGVAKVDYDAVCESLRLMLGEKP